jgi:hypothetical protein
VWGAIYAIDVISVSVKKIGNDSLALNTRQERTDSARPECDSPLPH